MPEHKRVVFITGHYLGSDRKAGFHWMADACHRRGDEVLFLTTSLSQLSRLKNHYLFRYPVLSERNRMIEKEKGLWSYVWFPPFHPVNFRSSFVNRILAPILRQYPRFSLGECERYVQGADVIVFESVPAITLFEKIKKLNPNAKFVYRVSDDLAFMKNHPIVVDAETNVAPQFDLVSVPYQSFLKKFPGSNAVHHLHGIRKELFDRCTESPYKDGGTNAVFVGLNFFDYEFLSIAASLRPNWNFHIIGIPKKLESKNIRWHGELPFDQTIPYIKFADVGLLNLVDIPGSEYFTDTLKTIQYSYCRLPILAPKMLRSDRNNLFLYEPNQPDSIEQALQKAEAADRSTFCDEKILSWDELVQKIV
ncbi:UDP-glucuronate:glycolipid 2-beta-glucuronosyltransferase [Planctomycetes bacterium CA13]|uniref:UDP-glucuronate:glycolipid 2-beta-glucuronosyltransferase n=1 Tax=Novipirellula herctigrandis TaxID=2527986 RepID=A0A5C5YW09_9BACT|nr:UDP-glucuronate:glycolipid 2-beta-glucuronosyltransferase [Planctomycetes bacterium CA13]